MTHDDDRQRAADYLRCVQSGLAKWRETRPQIALLFGSLNALVERVDSLLGCVDRLSMAELALACKGISVAHVDLAEQYLRKAQRKLRLAQEMERVCAPILAVHPDCPIYQCLEELRATGQLQADGVPSAGAIRVADVVGRS